LTGDLTVAKNAGDYIPAQGDVVWLDFSPTKGHEQDGRRPALVLSPKSYNAASGLMLVCAITSKSKKYPFEVPIKGKVKGVILCDQLRTIDYRARSVRFAHAAPEKIMGEVKHKLWLLLP